MKANNEISILFENESILAINKPSGLIVHSDGRTDEPTLVDWILKKYPETKNIGEPIELTDGRKIMRPGIVHRLDRETTGVMLIAKTQESFLHLKKQFQGRKIKKKYHAFVYGRLKDTQGVIERPLGKSRKDFRLWSAQRGARGELRDAVTEYEVEREGAEVSYIEVTPKTGRTHQIRVHFKAIHHPVVCDKLYAPKHKCLLGFERLALHAISIEYETPAENNHLVEAPLPSDFKQAISLSNCQS